MDSLPIMLGKTAVRVMVSVALAYLMGLVVWLTGWGEGSNQSDTLTWARWCLAGLIFTIGMVRVGETLAASRGVLK